VFDMPWSALVQLTLLADDIAEQRKKQAASQQPGNFRRMA